MTLTDKDYENMAVACTECVNAGISRVSVDKGDLAVILTVDVEVDGYREDDYYNGTGYFIPTAAVCRVIDVEYDTCDDNLGLPVVDKSRIEELAYDMLMQF